MLVENYPVRLPCGRVAQYTLKHILVKPRLPGFAAALVPEAGQLVEEFSWSSFPWDYTEYRMPYFGSSVALSVMSAYRPGGPERYTNALGLSPVDLARREVITKDLLDLSTCKGVFDLSQLSISARVDPKGRFPLRPGWFTQSGGAPVLMTCYKVFRCKIALPLVGSRIERALLSGIVEVIGTSHPELVARYPEWRDLSLQQIRELESHVARELAARFPAGARSALTEPPRVPALAPPVAFVPAPDGEQEEIDQMLPPQLVPGEQAYEVGAPAPWHRSGIPSPPVSPRSGRAADALPLAMSIQSDPGHEPVDSDFVVVPRPPALDDTSVPTTSPRGRSLFQRVAASLSPRGGRQA